MSGKTLVDSGHPVPSIAKTQLAAGPSEVVGNTRLASLLPLPLLQVFFCKHYCAFWAGIGNTVAADAVFLLGRLKGNKIFCWLAGLLLCSCCLRGFNLVYQSSPASGGCVVLWKIASSVYLSEDVNFPCVCVCNAIVIIVEKLK